MMCPTLIPHPTDRLEILRAHLRQSLTRLEALQAELEILGQDLDDILTMARVVQTQITDY